MLQALDMFLTAYDPSDLPGGSVDPLGFDRGYTFLADSILPGMTNVASRPRYLSVLCTGVFLADVEPDAAPRRQREKRRDRALRFERLWALANALASQRGESSSSGIRGITYVLSELTRLEGKGASGASAKYKLLARQQQYGAFGMYGAIAEGMRFLDRRNLALTPDAGMRLAEAFIEETALPPPVLKAVRADKDDVEVALDVLADWGERAHVEKKPEEEEAALIREALHRDPTRSRTVEILAAHPWQKSDGDDDGAELRRILRVAQKLDPGGNDQDLRAAMLAIVAYEGAYQLSLLVFERLLWLCRTAPSGSLSPGALRSDEVLAPVRDALGGTVQSLIATLEEMRSTRPTLGFERIEDARQFLRAIADVDDNLALARCVLGRHADVQHGKFDRGRRKMPWVEETSNGISLTMTRAGGRDFEVTLPEQIRPHYYRLGSAEMFHRQGGTP